MFYLGTPCPTCEVGCLAFCRHHDGVTLGILCERCDTLYEGPEQISAKEGSYPPHEALGDDAEVTWASQNELDVRGWLHHTDGECLLVADQPYGFFDDPVDLYP
jgi:hypothetical protein